MRMLFDYYDTDRLVICLDPNNIDLMRDFYSDRSTTRLLEIQCDFSDEYLIGHAKRVGLAGERTSKETIDVLLPTIRSRAQLWSIGEPERDCVQNWLQEQFSRLKTASDNKVSMPSMAHSSSIALPGS